MGKLLKIRNRLALGLAIMAALNILLIAVVFHVLPLTADPFSYSVTGMLALVVSGIGYLAGSVAGRRIEQKDIEIHQEEHEQSETANKLEKANGFLETETIDLKKHEQELLKANRLLDKHSRELEENQLVIMGMMNDTNKAREGLEHANQQLLIEREKAEQATRSKSDFLASMSHEIRTPLNGIIGTASLFSDTRLSKEQHEFLRIIQNSGDTLLSLLNDILDFSKIEAGKLDIELRPFDLRDTCEQIIELLAPTALEKGIDLSLFFSPDIPPSLEGDAGRIRQVLTNLTSNALKFTRKGYVHINIDSVSKTDTETFINFCIKDSGVGISHDNQLQLFQKFSQGDSSTTREYGGSGLGLAICKQLVDLMGGTIGMESEQGKGSTFWFKIELPIAKQPQSSVINKTLINTDRQAEDISSTPTPLPEKQNTHHILIVEDNVVNQTVSKRMLIKGGLKVDVAENGKQALQKIMKGTQYDLIFMDCQMPVMDGYEASRRIREYEKGSNVHIPIIALTANAMQGDREKCIQAGMDDHLPKPVKKEMLLNMIQQHLN